MTLYQWTLGARVSGKPCCSDQELSNTGTGEDTGKEIPLIVPDHEPYFCETQPAKPPAGQKIDPSYVTLENTPTILVEMWHNVPIGSEELPPVTSRICYHVQNRLAPTTNSTAAGVKTW